MKSVLTFALGAAAGAAAAHFLDPDSGRKRRNQMRDQAQSTASSAASAVQSQAQHAAGAVKGAAHSATPGGGLESPDDVTLARKVETEIFRPHDAPKGTVSVDVQAGVAYLRGEAPPEWIDRLAAAARAVDGIEGVKNLLHSPGTPTPAAEPRFLAAEHYHRS
jgi:osmotically-inducible protein OsmY